MEDGLIFGLNRWGEFGMRRFRCTLQPNEKRTIPIVVPRGKWYVIFRYRFGDIAADTIQFRFDNLLNYFEQDILIGTELLNHTTWPKPYLVASGDNGAIIVWNTDDEERDFSIVLDFYVINNEIQGEIRKLILGEREKFRGGVTQQQYKPSKTDSFP